MNGDVVHLPGSSNRWPKMRPACGVRGVMTLEVDGVRSVPLGEGGPEVSEVSRVTQPLVTCRRCLDAMMLPNPGATLTGQRWRQWLLTTRYGTRGGSADEGCAYTMRVRRNDDAPLDHS